ncbi:MAG: hypothetical protein WDN04_10820 [Rhodospirillales bacterium]
MARRIAIVEDDAAIRANYADAFRKHGYAVAAYGSRKEAVVGAKLARARSRPARHRSRRRARRRLYPVPRIARHVAHAADHFPDRARQATSTRCRACAWAPTTTSPRT